MSSSFVTETLSQKFPSRLAKGEQNQPEETYLQGKSFKVGQGQVVNSSGSPENLFDTQPNILQYITEILSLGDNKLNSSIRSFKVYYQ